MTYTNPSYSSNLKCKVEDNVTLFMDSSTGKIIEKKNQKAIKNLVFC